MRVLIKLALLGALGMALFIGQFRSAGETVSVASARIYVIDGDTIDIDGTRYRLMGYDTPETYRARCASERNLGETATYRLRQLIRQHSSVQIVSSGRFDKYGRHLARLEIGGRDVGEIMIAEGLARRYSGGKRSGWC